MNSSTFRQLMEHDPQLRERLSYAAPGGGHRWWFTAKVWEWVDGRDLKALRLLPPPKPPASEPP